MICNKLLWKAFCKLAAQGERIRREFILSSRRRDEPQNNHTTNHRSPDYDTVDAPETTRGDSMKNRAKQAV